MGAGVNTIYIDTTQTVNGDGTKETPFNYLSQGMVDTYTYINIEKNSVVTNKLIVNLFLRNLTISGYDSTNAPIPISHGPAIWVNKAPCCILVNTNMSVTNKLILKDIRLFGWSTTPIIVDNVEEYNQLVTLTNVTTINLNENNYDNAWRRITVRT